MKIRDHALAPVRAKWPLYALGLVATLGFFPGCASAPEDPRFSAETKDEYAEPLANAVISSPSGTITIGPDGGVTEQSSSSSSSSLAPPGSGGVGSGSGGADGSAFGGPPVDAAPGPDSGPFEDGGDAGQPSGGFGLWHFDDCSPTSHFLADSSGQGANAQHALKGACVPGINGLGVEFRSAKDIVQVPDEPQFTVSSRIAVAAWVFPTTVAGDQPIVIKRLDSKTSFSLGVHKGNIEMSVVLTDGTTLISRAPLPANTWSHVAGMFDGTFLYLFLDGQQFGQVFGGGTLRDVFAPIRIGATTQSQYFHGTIDEVFVSTENITKDALTALSCISKPSSLAVNPLTGGPAPFDTPVHYEIRVADNDVGFCQPAQYNFFFQSFDPSIQTVVDSPPGPNQTAQPGDVAVFGVDVSATADADPGAHSIGFVVDNFSKFEFLSGNLNFLVAQPTGCFVSAKKELMITSTSVVDDPVRAPSPGSGFAGDGGVSDGGFAGGPEAAPPSVIDAGTAFASGGFAGSGSVPGSGSATSSGSSSGAATSSGKSGGASSSTSLGPKDASSPDAVADAQVPPPGSAGVWTFGHLMRNIAPTPESAPAMTEQLFDTWLADQKVNGFVVAARPLMKQILLGIWPRTATGELDLDRAPMRLQAIVNRVDLRNLSAGSAGEGRFVFGVNDASGFPQQFTVIVEYNLPASTPQDVLDWANRWHALSSHPFPSEEYNAALEAITERFAGRNASPGSVNGSALVSLRTNEIVLSGGIRWELREFQLSPATGFLHETPVEETPDLGFNGTSTFADFVNQNATNIIAEVPGAAGVVPADFDGGSFLGGSVFNDLIEWNAPGIQSSEARFHASLNTCNGCHGPETNTGFLMITPRFPGNEASLSSFITGTTVFDPISRQPRTLNDLSRRRDDLTALVCGSPGDGGATGDAASVDVSPPPISDVGVSPPVQDASAGPAPR